MFFFASWSVIVKMDCSIEPVTRASTISGVMALSFAKRQSFCTSFSSFQRSFPVASAR